MDYREKGKRVTINRHVSSKYIKATIPYSKKSEKTIRLVKSDLGEIFNNNVLRTISNKEVVKNKETYKSKVTIQENLEDCKDTKEEKEDNKEDNKEVNKYNGNNELTIATTTNSTSTSILDSTSILKPK